MIMKSLRRYEYQNTDYFITCVSFNRETILLNDMAIFWNSWNKTFLKAWVVLPDHFHVILNSGNSSISKIMHLFKIKYSRAIRDNFRPSRVWQNRYWDHMIRNQKDFNNHLDYIHYNPVKHGLVDNPFDYEYSSLNKYATVGRYNKEWGVREKLEFEGDYGE